MTPSTILIALWAGGVSLRLTPDGQNLTAPAGKLTPQQRALVLAQKPELVDFLQASRTTTTALIEAAMLRCDQWGDGEPAREAMRTDCLATPAHLQGDLLDYFNRVNKT
jgi:hypothetical protein